jgi:hypothetical protein
MNDNVELDKDLALVRLDSIINKAIKDNYPMIGIEIKSYKDEEFDIIIVKPSKFQATLDRLTELVKEDAIIVGNVDYADYVDEMKFFKE